MASYKIKGNTTVEHNLNSERVIPSIANSVPLWSTSVIYQADDLIIQSNKFYKCLIGHTSGTFATDLIANNWGEVSADTSAQIVLTYGRVNATVDLANIAFVTTGTGTKIPFNATVYSNGVTFSGTDSIIPSVTGRYRVNFFAQSGSGQFNGNGTFHVVQNNVSLGNIYVDMMEAAGINQTTPTIDVNLVAGLAVELRYQPDVADSIIWQKGSYFDISQIAGHLPATGQTVDYVNATLSTDQTTNLTSGDHVKFNSVASGNIIVDTASTYSTVSGTASIGRVTLSAGKTYKLSGQISSATNAASGVSSYRWFNATTGSAITGSSIGWIISPANTSTNQRGGISEAIFTPSVDTLVELRILNNMTTPIDGNEGTSIFIQQLGSTSNTVGTLPSVDQTSVGYFDIGNMRIQFGTHDDGNVDTTTVTLPVAFANTNYSVVATSNTSAGSLSTETKTTTTFDIDRASTTTTTQDYSWIAIGFKA